MPAKYTMNERLEIGREIYEKEMSQEEAAVRYSIDPCTARTYYRLYKATLKVMAENHGKMPRQKRPVPRK